MTQNFLKIIGAALVLLMMGPAVWADSATGFDVNDVNYLFPMMADVNHPYYPDIGLKFVLNGKDITILNASLFAEIVAKFLDVTSGELGAEAFSAPNFTPDEIIYFHITNFRYDPCFAGSPDQPAQCTPQIRLVAQPSNPHPTVMGNDNGFAVGERIPDFSMHLLFNVGSGLPQKSDPVLADMLELKKILEQSGLSQAGTVLQVSPALSREKANHRQQLGPVAAKIEQIIAKYATPANLSEITVTNGSADENDSLGRWNFVGGDVRDGHWVIKPIPRLQNSTTLERSESDGSISYLHFRPIPAPSVTINGRIQWKDLTESAKLAQLSDLEAIQNPRISNPRNVDCASCHVATTMTYENLSAGFPQKSLTEIIWKSPTGISGYADPQLLASSAQFDDTDKGLQNIHVIGYFKNFPVVSRLVAQSAAVVAETMNSILQLSPPTRKDCHNEAALSCLMTVNANAADCLTKCVER